MLLFFGAPDPALAVTYSNTSTAYSWIDASTHTKLGPTTGGVYSPTYRFNGRAQVPSCGTYLPSIDDAISDNIPLDFTFMYGGVNFTDVRIMSNGRLQFNNNTTCGYGSPVTQLPYPYYVNATLNLNYTMRAYGGDLDASLQSEISGYTTNCISRNDCYISYATIGTAPYRSFVVTWNNVPEWTTFSSASGNYNLQVILQENGEFIYQYGSSIPGPGHTVGQVGWQVNSATDDYTAPEVGFPAAGTAIKFFIPRPVAEYRMEQPEWNGTANEVYDTSGNGRHGATVFAGASTRPIEVASGKVCRGGQIVDNTAAADISAIDTGLSIPTVVGGVGTISFWYNNSSNNRMLFDATVASNQWFYLMRTSNRALRFVVSDSIGTRRVVTTSNNAIPNSGWTHIAVTWNFNALAAANSDRLRIYVNGALSATSAFSTAGTVSASVGTLYIGDNRSGFIDAGASGRSAGNPGGANATLDEFRIYNYEGGVALVQRDMSQAGACLNHYAIATSGTPSVCAPVQPVQVTVTAHDNAHGLITMPNNTTQVTLSVSSSATPSTTPTAVTNGGNWSLVSGYGSFSNGTADDGLATYIFNGEYQAVLNYQPTVSGNVYAHVTDGQIVELENVVIPVAGCPPSSFNCVETGQAGGTGRLYTKLAGTAFGFDVFALKSDGSSTETGYTGPIKIELVDGGVTCGTAASFQTVTASQAMTSGKYTVPASGAGSATVSNAYPNVRCRITDVNNTSLKSCSSDNFAVRPLSFTVTAALGGATLPAGNDFTLTATTAVAAGYTGTPALDTALVRDHNGAAAGTLTGAFAAATGTSAAGTFQYHDIGTISLLADAVTDGNYTTLDQGDSDCVLGSTANTLAGGKYGCNIGSAVTGAFGRFYPHHFTYAAVLTPACAGGGFTYMDQNALGINLSLSAKSANETLTSRYTAGYATLGAFTITGDNGGTAVPVARLMPALPAFAWTDGLYAVAGDRAFTRNALPDGPYDNFALQANVNDPDGALIAGAVLSNTTRIRFGVLRLDNAYGSELLPLRVPARTTYWNSNRWVTHADDNCTSLPNQRNNLSLGNRTGTLTAVNYGAAKVPAAALPLVNGLGTIVLAAPDANTSGGLDIALNLGATGGDASCIGAGFPAATAGATLAWLRGNWCGAAGYVRDPNARVKFGSPKAPYIYLRERY